MTTSSPVDGDVRRPLPLLARLVAALPLALLAGLVHLGASALLQWGSEARPLDQVLRDLPALVVVAVSGAAAGGLLAWAVAGSRRAAVVLGLWLGLVPGAIHTTSYFTSAF